MKNDIKSIENNDINSIKGVIVVGHANFENENYFGNADKMQVLPKERIMILEGAVISLMISGYYSWKKDSCRWCYKEYNN